MEQKISRQFFLGANTGAGFVSLYSAFAASEDGAFVWYIKGGPGNGKSTLMRRAAERAEEAGFAVESILCSGDPDSLDGIYIPEKKLGYVDATSPHVQEPAVPGASGKYLDLGAFYRPIPPEEAEKMRRLFAAYRREYARAYDMLHAARLVSPGGIPGVLTAEAKARVRKRAEAFAEKAVHRSEAEEYEKRRFLSAYTCRGAVLFSETAASFGRVYTLDNELGLADDFLQAVLERARSAGAARIVCPDPVDPEKLAALVLPEDGLSLVAVSGDFRFDGKAARHFRLDTAAELSDRIPEEIPALVSRTVCYLAKSGELIDAGADIARVGGKGALVLNVAVPERNLSKIRKGQTALLTLSSVDGKFAGQVKSIGKSTRKQYLGAVEETVADVMISIESPSDKLKSGDSGYAEIQTGLKRDIVTLPYSAVMQDEKSEYIYVIENGRTTRRDVITGLELAKRTQVFGVSVEEEVVKSTQGVAANSIIIRNKTE